MLLILSLVAVLAFLVLPLLLTGGANRQATPALFYFVAVGLGYILVEVTFIQRFVLFLGHPTYALTVVVFLMMLASGAGSLISTKWLRDSAPGLVAADADCSRPAALCRCAANDSGTPGGRGICGQAAYQRRASGASGLCHGDAVSHWTARTGGDCARRSGWQFHRVGLGDECCVQRAGVGAGDCHCHSVRVECYPVVRGGGLSGGIAVAGQAEAGARGCLNLWRKSAVGFCYYHQEKLGRVVG